MSSAANKERNRRRVPTRVAAGLKPVTLEAETVSFYRLDGTPVAFKQAAAELSSLHPVFFLDRTSKPPSSLSDIQQQAFPDDMLIVVTEQAVRERYRRGYVYR